MAMSSKFKNADLDRIGFKALLKYYLMVSKLNVFVRYDSKTKIHLD